MPKRPQILTVGHSTHPIEEFIQLLQSAEVTSVVDVRSLPGSTKYPQFNQENLMPVLENAGISYVRIEKLGGLRKKTPEISDDVNAFWENKSFRRYADYALTQNFREGFAELEELIGSGKLPAVMCAEAVWWRCHRRIIADYLLAHKHRVSHLMPQGKTSEATLTRGAQIGADGAVTYPSS